MLPNINLRLSRFLPTKLPRVHMLHIGKTGGTVIKDALRPFCRQGSYQIHLHSHRVYLEHIPQGEKVFFFLRHPVDRFVSGFYSRLRRGRPRYRSRWTAGERRAFSTFVNPSDLGESLSSDCEKVRLEGINAMREIRHVRSFLWDWFQSPEYFESRLPDVLFVGFQESLDRDFQILLSLLRLNETCTLSDDPIRAHKNPKSCDCSLTPLAFKNLTEYYAADILFFKQLKNACFRRDRTDDCGLSWYPAEDEKRLERPPVGG